MVNRKVLIRVNRMRRTEKILSAFGRILFILILRFISIFTLSFIFNEKNLLLADIVMFVIILVVLFTTAITSINDLTYHS